MSTIKQTQATARALKVPALVGPAPKSTPKLIPVPARKRAEPLKIELHVDEFRSLPIPGVEGAKMGDCFVRVTDIPGSLDAYMEVNPRVPQRTGKGVLTGHVPAGIRATLHDNPDAMVLKNQGIYLLVEAANFEKGTGGKGTLSLTFTDPGKHGIVNGGHTYAAIRSALEQIEGEEDLKSLQSAWVRLHILQGIDEDLVPEIAEGLNRSKQVDDPSLMNLQGEFDAIRKVLKGVTGEKAVAYHQGDEGDVYISEILVYLEMFNQNRFNERKHPNGLYNKQGLGLKYFSEDMGAHKADLLALMQKLPDFLWLADSIRRLTPDAAKRNNFKFGQIKMGGERAGGARAKGTNLPFIGESVNYRVPNGWVYPMLAAFRANLKRTEDGKSFEWKLPLSTILPEVMDDLVGVCVAEHRDNNTRPDLIGKRESAYSQCHTKFQLYLAKRNLLY